MFELYIIYISLYIITTMVDQMYTHLRIIVLFQRCNCSKEILAFCSLQFFYTLLTHNYVHENYKIVFQKIADFEKSYTSLNEKQTINMKLLQIFHYFKNCTKLLIILCSMCATISRE